MSAWTVSLGALCALLLSAACAAAPGADAAPAEDAAVMDVAILDGAAPDASTDGGAPDSGALDLGVRDALVVDAGPAGCVVGGEGCACIPGSAGALGRCLYSDNLCVQWPGDVPLTSCVTPCTSDLDCGLSDLGQVCAEVGLPTKICTTRAAGRDEPCRGSRVDGQPVVGCGGGLVCVQRDDPALPADQGRCAELCVPTTRDPSGGCRGDFPYCNPRAVERDDGQGATEVLGVCSVGPVRDGNYCSVRELSARCDTDPQAGELRCMELGVGPVGRGVCVEYCSLADPQPSCRASDGVFGAARCTQFLPDQPRRGVCTFPCSALPENCPGSGREGLGRTCVDLTLDPGLPVNLCWDVLGPPLRETIGAWNEGAPAVEVPGDNCFTEPSGRTRCPDGLGCVSGACLRGCDVDQPGRTCARTSTAAACYAFPTPNAPTGGLCLVP